jgi:hypothetical protein
MSGFCRRTPPSASRLELPLFASVPFALKKTRREPSDEKFSRTLTAVKTPGYGPLGFPTPMAAPAGVAATEKAPAAAECPLVCPVVVTARR